MTTRAIVLVPEAALRAQVALILETEASVAQAADDREAYAELLRGAPDLVVAGVSDESALARESLLVGLLSLPSRPAFVAIVPENGLELSARFLRRGAAAVLRRPFLAEEAKGVFRRVLEARENARERALLLADLEGMRNLVHDALLNVMDGVLVIDGGGKVLFANAEAARILLQDRWQLVGTKLDANFAGGLFRLLKLARDSADRTATDEALLISGAEEQRLVGRASIIYDAAGNPTGGLITMRAGETKRVAGRVVDPATRPATNSVGMPRPGTSATGIPRPSTGMFPIPKIDETPARPATNAAGIPRPSSSTDLRPAGMFPIPKIDESPARPATNAAGIPRPASAGMFPVPKIDESLLPPSTRAFAPSVPRDIAPPVPPPPPPPPRPSTAPVSMPRPVKPPSSTTIPAPAPPPPEPPKTTSLKISSILDALRERAETPPPRPRPEEKK